MTQTKKTKNNRPSETDWARLKRMREGKEPIDTSDIPEANESFWENAEFGHFPDKIPVSVRFDKDIIDWFKSQGPCYQTRMNKVLRTYMNWKLSCESSAKKPHTRTAKKVASR